MDESDYAMALSQGFTASYLGLSEASGWAFISQLITDRRNGVRSHPWREEYLTGDASAKRHLHPPVGLYPSTLLFSFGWTDERLLRAVPLVLGLLACLATGVLAFQTYHGSDPVMRRIAAIAAVSIVAVSPFHIAISVNYSFHAAYGLFSTAFLAACVLAARRRSLGWWYASCALWAACMLTIEYAILLVPSLVLTLWLTWPHDNPRPRRLLAAAGTGLVWIAATITVLWPPYLWRLAAIKPALVYLNLVLNPVSESGLGSNWGMALAERHWALALLAIALPIGLSAAPKAARRWAWPVVIYAALFVLANLRVSHMKELYAGHLVLVLAALVCAYVLPLLERTPVMPRAAALAFLTAVLAVQTIREPRATTMPWRDGMAELEARSRGRVVLATPVSIFGYYLREATILPIAVGQEERNATNERLRTGEINGTYIRRPPLDRT